MADAQQAEKWYRVCLNTIVRAGEELDSERLRILPMGSRVCVVEAAKSNGRRVRIKSPIQGWCSMSSSNGDTILAPIEDPNDVPNTPKSISAKVTSLQQRRDQQKKLLGIDGVDKERAQQKLAHMEQRVQEAQVLKKAKEDAFEADEEEEEDKQYQLNDIVYCTNNLVGVVRWEGKIDTGDKYIGLEVQVGSGNCDGTHKASKARHFKVQETCGMYVKSEDVLKPISTVSILSKLENKISEAAITWKKYTDLLTIIENHNASVTKDPSLNKEQKKQYILPLPDEQ